MPQMKSAAVLAAQSILRWIIFCGGWCIIRLYMMFGRVRVVGLKEALEHIKEGGVVVAANHPSLIEPFVLGGIFARAFVFDMKKCPWSVPDKGFYSERAQRFLRPILKLIPHARGNAMSGAVILEKLVQLVDEGHNVIVHPESGRTCKGSRFLEKNGRRMRVFSSSIASCALAERIRIIPVWIEFYDKAPESFLAGLWRITWRHRMTVHFGSLYETNPNETREERNNTLAERILSA